MISSGINKDGKLQPCIGDILILNSKFFMYKSGLFKDWIPKKIKMLLLALGAIPFLSICGVYNSNFTYMYSSMGFLSEYVNVAYYLSFAGMGVGMSFMIRNKRYFRPKQTVLGTLILLSVFSWISSTTSNPWVIIICSFFIGVFRMLGSMEFIVPIMLMISPQMIRSRYYPVFYPIVISLSQILPYLFSYVALHSGWQDANKIMAIYMCSYALVAVFTMHDSRATKKIPYYQVHWLSIAWFSIVLFLFIYILSFAKYYGWSLNSDLSVYCILFVVALAVFVWQQRRLKRPVVPLYVLRKHNVYMSIIIMGLAGMFMSTRRLQTIYMSGILKYDWQSLAELNSYMVPGAILGGILCFFWFKKELQMKTIVFLGFFFLFISQFYTYILISPTVEITSFILPNVFKGMGLITLYVSIGVYCSLGLERAEYLSALSVLIFVRSAGGNLIFSTIYSWAFYKMKLQSMTNLAGVIDAAKPIAKNGVALYGSLSKQAVMVGFREVVGYSLILGLIVIAVVLINRYEPMHPRKRIQNLKRYTLQNLKEMLLRA